jgi:hypothetical protein
MKITSKLAIPLLMLPLAGSAWADATQTAPGAAHGVGSGHAATSTTAQPDKSGNIGAGQTGVGGTANALVSRETLQAFGAKSNSSRMPPGS